MAADSVKCRLLIAEPISWKKVTDIPGIGAVLGDRFKKHDIFYAKQILGQFLVYKKDKKRFMDWMRQMVRANAKQCRDCYECLNEWCDSFL